MIVLPAATLPVPARASQAGPASPSAQVSRDNEAIFAEPGGVRIGRVARGESLRTGTTRSGHTQVTLEGWIFRASVTADNRDGHNLRVSRAPEENLRSEPNGRIVARLVEGALLTETERRGNWVRVRRTAWAATAGLATATAARPPAQQSQQTAPPRAEPPPATQVATQRDTASAQAPADPVDPRRGVSRRRMQLFRAPDSAAIGSLEAGLPVRITARAGDWVRIETQGWVRESEIRLSDAGIISGVTAAELRGAPDDFRGRLLRWTIQFIALQTADDLRPDFAPGQKYMLARGPAPEYAFVYIIVPDDRLAAVQRLEPLASVTVVARVLAGRSTYLANPILELVDFQP